MIKYNIKQLNKLLAVTMLIAIFLSTTISTTNASILSWFSSNDASTTDNQNSGFVNYFLSTNDQLTVADSSGDKGLPVIQDSSLVSIGSPVSAGQTSKVKNSPSVLKEFSVVVTAYSSTPDQTDDSPFITAMGTHVREGIIAANFLPFGTKIKIPEVYGDKVFVVEDRMNRRYWYNVDVWLPDRASAKEFGVKKVKIQIVES